MGFASLNPSYEAKNGAGPRPNSSTKTDRWERSFFIFRLITSKKIFIAGIAVAGA